MSNCFPFLKTGIALFCALSLSQCGSDSSSSGSGDISLILKSTTLSTRSRAGSSCTVSYDSTNASGLCYTPIEVTGYFNVGLLSNTGGGTPVRILGGGTTSGLSSVFKKSQFNLKSSPTIASQDNIQDGGGSYNLVNLEVQSVEVAFYAEATNKVYRTRIPFTTTPPSANSSFSSCGLGGGLTTADELGSLFGSVTAQPGDILVCIKSTTSDTCSDTDYQWVDNTGTLFSTRPASPLRLTGTYLRTADSCSSGSSHPDITWGSATLNIGLGSSFTVNAAFGSGGTKTYTLSSGSGTKLILNLDISTTNSLFVPTSALNGDLNSFTQTQILQQIQSVLLKPVYVANNKSSASVTSDGMLSATLSASVQ